MNIGKCLPIILCSSSKYSIVNKTLRSYAFKSDLKIKWVRPEKIPCYKPEKSGDLEPMPEIDKKQFRLEFRDSKELQDANETVQKLFTLEFAPRRNQVQTYLKEISQSVQRHPLDKSSIESKIARWTGVIRALQEVMETFPRNKRVKVELKELIDKRKKHLKYLRRWDYKKFEWLIENLNIVYKPPPPEFHWITRKDSLRKLTNKYCDDLVKRRLNDYKLVLQEEQPAFLAEKIRSLKFIRSEQESCDVQVTVTEEEIQNIEQQLADILKERKSTVQEE